MKDPEICGSTRLFIHNPVSRRVPVWPALMPKLIAVHSEQRDAARMRSRTNQYKRQVPRRLHLGLLHLARTRSTRVQTNDSNASPHERLDACRTKTNELGTTGKKDER